MTLLTIVVVLGILFGGAIWQVRLYAVARLDHTRLLGKQREHRDKAEHQRWVEMRELDYRLALPPPDPEIQRIQTVTAADEAAALKIRAEIDRNNQRNQY